MTQPAAVGKIRRERTWRFHLLSQAGNVEHQRDRMKLKTKMEDLRISTGGCHVENQVNAEGILSWVMAVRTTMN